MCPGAAFTLGGWGWAASPTGTTLQCSASATQGFAGCKHPPACCFSYSAGFTSSRAWSDADTGARVGYSNTARVGAHRFFSSRLFLGAQLALVASKVSVQGKQRAGCCGQDTLRSVGLI